MENNSYKSKFEIPQEYIKAVAKGFSKGFIFLGPQGIGKTYNVINTLEGLGVDYVVSRGVTSPMALYIFLFENKNKVIVYDDTRGLVNNNNAFSILLGALWDGLISWNSTSDKLTVPSSFNFDGRIIIVANSLQNADIEVLKSRTLIYNLYLTVKEKLSLMEEIAKQEHPVLKEAERLEILNFIKENVDESSIFDLRTQQKSELLYLFNREKWKDLVKPLIAVNDELNIFLNCLSNHSSVTDAEREFIRESGLSRRTFYRMLKQHKN